ncbi:MAG: bifunctional riboflavin kinase/FAD synthetase [Acidobacteria bacterium]|nr:bifunctional riboflavin kinase/FAD synthetase [Acidobacteriota bacterium]
MRVVRDLSELREPLHSSAVTIGNFDGVHLAHRALLERVVRSAREVGGKAVVVTFDPHPAKVIAPARAPATLTPLRTKIALIDKENIEFLIILRFNEELARLSPAEFVQRVLVEKLGAVVVHVGSNFRFGRHRAGNTETLLELGKQSGFRVETLPMLTIRGEQVSSSRIRQLVADGRVDIAGRMLGRPYSVAGPVVVGEGLGHKQTVPTLNLGAVEQRLPKNGVYISRTHLGENVHQSVTNVGQKPTFGPHPITVESYLLDFGGKVDASSMEIEFLYRLRDEIKFPDPKTLRRQILDDVRRSLKFFRLLKILEGRRHRPSTSASTPA